eukprot:NODE_4636_length_640_cov_183.302876_g3978_i0.p2 GENE.NODE_4636_length_640_cov_183.302876_g3978_i0~~NODE_4636_length_640_cov_183.302876_g3978_i0.p2  ORF type:complete len:112 (-),score=8.22 NODE_4636_length_640_cov_183.302876_g3978_i0:99-434(-)
MISSLVAFARPSAPILMRASGAFYSTNLYVGNLSWTTTDEMLHKTFAQYGAVRSARVIHDRDTGRSRGFGFVELEDEQEASAAVAALHGSEMDGRNLRVNVAEPRQPRTQW